jgi:hypothetical protein
MLLCLGWFVDERVSKNIKRRIIERFFAEHIQFAYQPSTRMCECVLQYDKLSLGDKLGEILQHLMDSGHSMPWIPEHMNKESVLHHNSNAKEVHFADDVAGVFGVEHPHHDVRHQDDVQTPSPGSENAHHSSDTPSDHHTLPAQQKRRGKHSNDKHAPAPVVIDHTAETEALFHPTPNHVNMDTFAVPRHQHQHQHQHHANPHTHTHQEHEPMQKFHFHVPPQPQTQPLAQPVHTMSHSATLPSVINTPTTASPPSTQRQGGEVKKAATVEFDHMVPYDDHLDILEESSDSFTSQSEKGLYSSFGSSTSSMSLTNVLAQQQRALKRDKSSSYLDHTLTSVQRRKAGGAAGPAGGGADESFHRQLSSNVLEVVGLERLLSRSSLTVSNSNIATSALSPGLHHGGSPEKGLGPSPLTHLGSSVALNHPQLEPIVHPATLNPPAPATTKK